MLPCQFVFHQMLQGRMLLSLSRLPFPLLHRGPAEPALAPEPFLLLHRGPPEPALAPEAVVASGSLAQLLPTGQPQAAGFRSRQPKVAGRRARVHEA